MLVSSFMQHTIIDRNNKYFKALDRRAKTLRKRKQTMKVTLGRQYVRSQNERFRLKTTSIRWRSWSSVWKTSAACVRSRASRSRSTSTWSWWTVWSGSPARQRLQWRAGTGSPRWPWNISSNNTSPASVRIPFRSEYKAALTNES